MLFSEAVAAVRSVRNIHLKMLEPLAAADVADL